jgi:hypothetical protein
MAKKSGKVVPVHDTKAQNENRVTVMDCSVDMERICWLRHFRSLPNIRMTKSRRMRWAGNVARMGKRRGTHRVLVQKPEGKETSWKI